MAYDAVQALQGFYGIKEDAALDPAAGLVPLTSSLIPPLVAQAFGLPTLGGTPAPQPQPTLAPPQHAQSIYGSMVNPALMGAFGFGGAQYAAAIQQHSQLAGLPMGYLQALAAASQHHQHQQQQHQQQQQQQSTAALLAQTAGALHAHTAALAAAARSAPATSSANSQPMLPAPSSLEGTSGRVLLGEQDRITANTTATTSSVPKTSSSGAVRPVAFMPFQNPLAMQNLYAAFAQPHAAYSQSPASSFSAAVAPYGVHSAYYARPPDANAAAVAAAAAAAAATGAYGYSQAPSAVTYGGAFHPSYSSAPLDYSAALAAAAYRPAAAPPVLPAPSSNPQPSQSVGDEDYADDGSTRAIKRPRLVWTPQLHKKFESAVQKLGVDKAVPKNIMQEMNIDGLTRENVASHLQKYRMLRRKDTTSSEGRDSDSRTIGTVGTIGTKRSEPDSSRPAPAATTQTTSTLGGARADCGAVSALTGPTHALAAEPSNGTAVTVAT